MVVLLPRIGSGADCLSTGARPSTSGAARGRGEDLSAAMSWSDYLNQANPSAYGVSKPPEPDSEQLLAAVTAADAQARPATAGQSSSRFKAAAKTMETARRRAIEVGGFSMLRDLEVRARARVGVGTRVGTCVKHACACGGGGCSVARARRARHKA